MVFEDAVYAKTERNGVIVRDILGKSRVFDNCRIIGVDVGSTELKLSKARST